VKQRGGWNIESLTAVRDAAMRSGGLGLPEAGERAPLADRSGPSDRGQSQHVLAF